MDGSLWHHVVADLRPDYCCMVLTLPLGAHRRPMRPDADLSLRAMVCQRRLPAAPAAPLEALAVHGGWMSKRPVPDEIMDAWFRPVLTQPQIRCHLRKYPGSVLPKDVLLEWAQRQSVFEGPVFVLWASEDCVMTHEHRRRLDRLYPRGRPVEIPDNYTNPRGSARQPHCAPQRVPLL